MTCSAFSARTDMKKQTSLKRFLMGFVYAWRGICIAAKQRNFRIHLCAVVLVSAFAAVYGLTRVEWAVLFITMGLVIALEAVNTAIEQLCDRVTDEHDELIRRCKDIAAGAVLIAAIAAIAVAAALFADPQRLLAMQQRLFG